MPASEFGVENQEDYQRRRLQNREAQRRCRSRRRGKQVAQGRLGDRNDVQTHSRIHDTLLSPDAVLSPQPEIHNQLHPVVFDGHIPYGVGWRTPEAIATTEYDLQNVGRAYLPDAFPFLCSGGDQFNLGDPSTQQPLYMSPVSTQSPVAYHLQQPRLDRTDQVSLAHRPYSRSSSGSNPGGRCVDHPEQASSSKSSHVRPQIQRSLTGQSTRGQSPKENYTSNSQFTKSSIQTMNHMYDSPPSAGPSSQKLQRVIMPRDATTPPDSTHPTPSSSSDDTSNDTLMLSNYVAPLIICCARGHENFARALLSRGVDVNDTDSQGNTALHAALKIRHEGLVRLLLAHHADPNAVNNEGWTPLHQAADGGFEEGLRLLEHYGAMIEPSRRKRQAVAR